MTPVGIDAVSNTPNAVLGLLRGIVIVPGMPGFTGDAEEPFVGIPYFLPPAVRRYPRPGTPGTSGSYRSLLYWFTIDPLEIGGKTYEGYWNGPLTDAEVAAITAAGHDDRIYYKPASSLPGDFPALD